MASTINTNVPSLNSQRNLDRSGSALSISLQRLSSGFRINSAKDDAAGLAISERFTAQIRGIDQGTRNSNDGVSLAQTGEGALASAGGILQRIRELAVQSVNASNSASDRAALQGEVSQLADELNRIATTTAFNGQKLLNNSSSFTFQVGANVGEVITTNTVNFQTDSYGSYRIGTKVATATNNTGDLVIGSSANALASNAAASNRVAGGTITIKGALGSATVTAAAAASAKTVAQLINGKTDTTGVRATAKTEFDITALSTADTGFSINITSTNTAAVTVSFTTGASSKSGTADYYSDAVNAINNVSSKTGVTAKVNSTNDGITLLNANGDNITITINSGTGGATIGGTATASGAAAIGTGSIILDSDRSFSIVAANTTDFFTATAATSQQQKVSLVDVGNVDAANRTIAMIDGALQAVNTQRAKFGALQSRFEAAIENSRTTSENLAASRSRIRDTDYANETANLTRNQILQQAGTAMLSQANTLPQQVLSLLK